MSTKAMILYKSALQFRKKSKKQDEIIDTVIHHANTYMNLKDHPNSLLIIDSAISVEIPRSSKTIIDVFVSLEILIANNQKDYKLAYESLRKYKSYNRC